MDLRKASKERFEDAEPAEFLMPFKEATIFLHRNSFDNVFEIFISFLSFDHSWIYTLLSLPYLKICLT